MFGGRHLRLAGVLGATAALAASSGCGGDDVAADPAGKQLFVQKCGACHALADAGTKGQIGPDLDFAFKQSVADGLGRDTISGVVRKQISLPQGPEMPADLVTGKDAEAVAAYVAAVIGKGASGPSGATTGDGTTGDGGGTAEANARNEVPIPADASGQLAYEFTEASARPGKVTLSSKNESPVPHDISLKGGGVDERGDEVSGGDTSKVTVNLKSGEYTFYCSVPGHEQGGMKGTLTVR